MKKDIILAGVGGQGILTIAAIIDWVALKQNLHLKQAEVHGMSQRGGAVLSHLRISSEVVYSGLISEGTADLILAVEPLESLRYLNYLSAYGVVVSSVVPHKNISNYPEEVEMETLLDQVKNKYLIHATDLAKEAGSLKAENIVMLGACSKFIDLPEEDFKLAIAEFFGRKGKEIVKINQKAFDLGREAVNSN